MTTTTTTREQKHDPDIRRGGGDGHEQHSPSLHNNQSIMRTCMHINMQCKRTKKKQPTNWAPLNKHTLSLSLTHTHTLAHSLTLDQLYKLSSAWHIYLSIFYDHHHHLSSLPLSHYERSNELPPLEFLQRTHPHAPSHL